MTAPCRTSGCTRRRSTWSAEGYCETHYAEFCRRVGSLRCAGFTQHLADALAAVDYQVLGHVPFVSLPVWPDIAKEKVA